MKWHTLAQFQRWETWRLTNDATVAATCAHFRIGRSTYYRWRKRREAERRRVEDNRFRRIVGAKARAKPHVKRGRRPVFWTDINFELISRLDMLHPHWGKRKVQAEMAAHGYAMSEATVGRMLAAVRRRCPVCHRRGRHFEQFHWVSRDWLRITG